jgi:exodeoxyribonuclease V alpha subunit
VLAGLVERVTFHNEENGFCVLRIKARGQRELITVVGHAAVISAGEWVTAPGEWVNDRTHGQQFKATFLKTSEPTSLDGIEKYLGSGVIRAVRIYKTYDADAVQVMSENPYRLARDIRGIGFKTADAIAMKLGIEKTATIRVRAGISYALTEAMDEGHCGLPTDELVPLAEKLLEVPVELVGTALDLELAEGTVTADSVDETPCVFLAGLHRAERGITERLLRLMKGGPPGPGSIRTRPCRGSRSVSGLPLLRTSEPRFGSR